MDLQVPRHRIGRVLGKCRDISTDDEGHQHHLLVALHYQGAQHIRRGGQELEDKKARATKTTRRSGESVTSVVRTGIIRHAKYSC